MQMQMKFLNLDDINNFHGKYNSLKLLSRNTKTIWSNLYQSIFIKEVKKVFKE